MKINEAAGKIIIYSIPLVTLSFTPFISYDPFNAPKFLSLCILGSVITIILVAQAFKQPLFFIQKPVIVSAAFIAWILISLIFSPSNLEDGMFGLPGRHMGVLTYIFLSIFLISSISVSDKRFLRQLGFFLKVTGVIVMIYGYLQVLQLDPVSWSIPPAAGFSFFGNQNFLSAFMGISSVLALSILFKTDTNAMRKFVNVIYIFASIILIYYTKSTQGFLIFFAGSSIFMVIWLWRSEKYSKFLPFFQIFIGAIVVFLLLDIFQKTPWPSQLYESSISSRGDFWRSAWRTAWENPIFGVGFDGFVDYYRLNRDLNSILARGSEIRADSAHNLFLDIFVGGGFIALLLFILVIFFVVKCSLKYIRNSREFDAGHAGLFGSWFAFIVQSSISVNQISLALVGWILSGTLIGYKVNSEKDIKVTKINPKWIAAVLISPLMGIFIGAPTFVQDAKFRQAISAGDARLLIEISNSWPRSSDRISLIGGVLRTNGFPIESREVLRRGIKFNPNHFETWRELYLCPGISDSERNIARKRMVALDPFGSEVM